MVAVYPLEAPAQRRASLRMITDGDRPAYDTESQQQRRAVVRTDMEAGETILATMGGNALGVYWHLCKRATDGECWPSLDDIAEATKLSRKHVTRILDDLEAGGWIERKRRTNRYGMATSTMYRIIVKSRTDGCDIDETRRGHGVDMDPSEMSHELVTNHIQTNNKPEDVNTPLPPETGGSDGRPKKPLPENGVAQQIVKAYCLVARLEQPANYRKAVGQAAALAKAGVRPEDIPELYEFVAGWAKSADLGLLLNQVDRWRSSKPRALTAEPLKRDSVDWSDPVQVEAYRRNAELQMLRQL